jgi:hypothetical protein
MAAPEKQMCCQEHQEHPVPPPSRNYQGSYFDDGEDLILLHKQQMTVMAKYSRSLMPTHYLSMKLE